MFCLHFQFMLKPLVPHQVQQLVYLANRNPFEFYINTVLPVCLGSADIEPWMKSVPKHFSGSKQLLNLAVSIRASYLQPGGTVYVYKRGAGYLKLNIVAINSSPPQQIFKIIKRIFVCLFFFRLISEMYILNQSL